MERIDIRAPADSANERSHRTANVEVLGGVIMGLIAGLSLVRTMALFVFSTSPVFVGLGIIYSKPEWVCAGGALGVYGLLASRQEGRPKAGRSSRAVLY